MNKMTRILSMVLVLALAVSLCACGGDEKKQTAGLIADNPEEHVELTWFLSATQPKGFEEVMEAANEYLKDKLNVTLDLVCIEGADYESKVQLALAADEKVDIIWTSNWKNKYEPNVSKGAFLPLDDYLELPELADLKNYYPEGIWDAATVAGKIYGMPVEQIFHNQAGATFIKSISDKYEVSDKIRNATSMEDIEEVFEIVREGEPEDFIITTTGSYDYFREKQATSTSAGTEIVDGKVSDRYDESFATAKRMREWNHKGFFPGNIATNDDNSGLVKEGKVYSGYSRYLPGVAGKFQINNGYEVIAIPMGEAVINRGGIQSTLNAISATSKNPVRALKLLHLLHTDEYMLNLLCYGIEGRDYTKDPDNPKRMERESGGYYIAEFMVGSQFLAYLVPSYEDGVWEQTKYENETARIDENIGFSFDPSSVESEISQISSVEQEYSKILSYGLDDPEVVFPECYEKKQLAGLQTVVDEIQRQYDEWKATQE